jgi:hypothetical protein
LVRRGIIFFLSYEHSTLTISGDGQHAYLRLLKASLLIGLGNSERVVQVGVLIGRNGLSSTDARKSQILDATQN